MKPERLRRHERHRHRGEPGKPSHRNCPSRGLGRVVPGRAGGVGATPGQGDQGLLGANPRGHVLTRRQPGSGKSRGSVRQGEERGGDAPLPHPQHNVPRRHSPGWSRPCSARICCAGRRGKALAQRRTAPRPPGHSSTRPGSATAAAPRGQHHPQALPDPAPAPRRARRCQDGDAGAPRAHGRPHPGVTAAPSPRALCLPLHPQPHSGALPSPQQSRDGVKPHPMAAQQTNRRYREARN